MEIKQVLEKIEKNIEHDNILYGNTIALTFESYSTYTIAVKLTEEFYKLTNLMSTESEELTEELIAEKLQEIAEICIKSIGILLQDEEHQEEQEEEEPRTIGFKVADKEEKTKTKRDEEKEDYKYPIDTYAVSYQEVYDDTELEEYWDE